MAAWAASSEAQPRLAAMCSVCQTGGAVSACPIAAAPAWARSEGLHGIPRQPLLYARGRCRLPRDGGATTGPREAGTAARRRLAAPVGLPPGRARPLPTPRRGQSPVIPR